MEIDDEILRQRLYRIFRIEDENYMYTMKVMYIYRWVDKRAPGYAFDVIADLRKMYKLRKNTERLDLMFRHMQSIALEKYAAPSNASAPQSQNPITGGWKVG